MRQELKDGLILRSLDEGHASDRENLAEFYKDTFGDAGDDDAKELIPWVDDLLSDEHPTTEPADFWVVVDPANDDKIASAILHIPQTWRYDDIDLSAGRIELVATDKDYRNRGLVRVQFEAAHERCASLGQVIQGVTGIPHYYRKFGYAMTVNLGAMGWLPLASIPKLKDDKEPEFTLRDATEADIPDLMRWHDGHTATKRMSLVRDESIWRFELVHRSANTPMSLDYKIIVNKEGRGVGYVAYNLGYTFGSFRIFEYVVGAESSVLASFDDTMRGLKAVAEAHTGTNGETPWRIYFNNGAHPAVETLITGTNGHIAASTYAWYIRVADIVAFLKTIVPVLERRLVGSGANGYTGEMTVAFHNQRGVKFHFEGGKIKDITDEEIYWADSAFPYDTFLNVVFGHRSITEIHHILPEAYANKKARVLLEAMFPAGDTALEGMA